MCNILRFIHPLHSSASFIRFILSLVLLSQMAFAHAATMLPISCFVNAQGSNPRSAGPAGCVVNNGDLIGGEMFIWGKNKNSPLYRADYAGVDAKTINTCGVTTIPTPTFTGTIVERTLSNGKFEQTIHLETDNALIYVVDASNPSLCANEGVGAFVLCPALFGFNLLENATGVSSTGLPVVPVLGDTTLDITLINTASGCNSIPDLIALTPPKTKGVQLQSLSLTATASGPFLRELFGVPDGTQGVATLDARASGASGLIGWSNTNVDLDTEVTGTTRLDVLQ